MPYVEGKLGELINNKMNDSNTEWDRSNFTKSIELLEEAWDLLPSDKISYSESFLIVWGILDVSILINDLDRMNKWVDKVFTSSPQRGDTGERELWAGKVAYETGDLEKAKSYLVLANQKSRGRCFGNKDGKYLRFLKQNS
jgi:hypothetical protein